MLFYWAYKLNSCPRLSKRRRSQLETALAFCRSQLPDEWLKVIGNDGDRSSD